MLTKAYTLTHSYLIRFFGCLLLIVLFTNNLQAQYAVERSITIDDGLPSNETYSSYFDKDGNLRILTDRGLAIYDGKQISVLDQRNGFTSNAIYKHFTAPDGKKWFLTNGGLSYEVEDSIVTPSFNSKLKQLKNINRTNKLDFLDNTHLRLGFAISNVPKVIIDLANDSVLVEKYIDTYNPKVKNQYVFYIVYAGSSFFSSQKLIPIDSAIHSNDSIWFFHKKEHTGNYLIKDCLVKDIENTKAYFSDGRTVFAIDTEKRTTQKLFESKSTILSLYLHHDHLFVCAEQEGVKRINLKSQKINTIIERSNVSSIQIAGNLLYASTLNAGLQVYNLGLDKKFDLPSIVSQVKVARPFYFKDSVFRFLHGSVLESYHLDKSLQLSKSVRFPALEKIYSYSKIHWVGTDSVILPHHKLSISTERSTYNRNEVGFFYGFYSSDFNQDDYHYGSEGLLRIRANSDTMLVHQKELTVKINTIYEFAKDSIVLGTKEGLYLYEFAGLKKLKTKSEVLNTADIRFLQKTAYGKAFGTRARGVVLVDNAGLTFELNKNSGLLSDAISAFFYQRDTLWIGTPQGIQYLTYNEDSLKVSPAISHINVMDLYASNTGVYAENDVSMFHIKAPKTTLKHPKLILFINEQRDSIGIKDKFAIRKGESLNLRFKINDLWKESYSIYASRLLPNDTNWNYHSTSIRSLEPTSFGTYSFEIKGRNSLGQWTETKSVNFEVRPYIYQRTWFQPLLYTLLGLLIGVVIYSLQKQKDRNLRRENLMLQSSLNSLKLQINPHFIFNALNSLQYLITTDKKRESSKFLTHFASLVRDILDSSQENLVNLEEEVNRLNTYLGLEEARLEKGEITLEINNGTSYELSQLLIPNMLLQPLVENAIWHGFVNSEKQPKLKLTLYNKGDKGMLLLELIDNGVGIEIEELKEHQQEGSLAIKNIQERLHILSKLERKHFSIKFEKAYGSFGTKVSLHLPLKKQL